MRLEPWTEMAGSLKANEGLSMSPACFVCGPGAACFFSSYFYQQHRQHISRGVRAWAPHILMLPMSSPSLPLALEASEGGPTVPEGSSLPGTPAGSQVAH